MTFNEIGKKILGKYCDFCPNKSKKLNFVPTDSAPETGTPTGIYLCDECFSWFKKGQDDAVKRN
jgi:hypothetical protein